MAKKRKKLLWILLGILLALVLLAVCLPAILSSGPARNAILKKINAGIPGELAIESWKLAWLGRMELNGIRFRDEAAGADVALDRLTVEKGILRLLPSNVEAGEIVLEKPVITVAIPAPAEVAPSKDSASGPPPGDTPSGAPGGKPSGTSAPGGTAGDEEPAPLEIEFAGVLRIVDGHVTVIPAPGSEPVVLEAVNARAKVTGLNEPIEFTLAAKQGGTGGALDAAGSVTLFKEGILDPAAITGNIQVKAGGFDLAQPGRLAAALAGAPAFTGILDSDITLQFAGPDSLVADGGLSVPRLALSGEPLSGDAPVFDGVKLDVSLRREKQALIVDRLSFTSSVARVTAAGQLKEAVPGKLPAGTLDGSVDVDLAALAAQLPRTLKLKPGLAISSGGLSARTRVVSQPAGLVFSSRVQARDLAAVQDGRAIVMDKPITLSATGGVDEARVPYVEELNLESPFASLMAKGRADDLRVALSADLAAATAEAGKFVDLQGKSFSGKLGLTAGVKTQENGLRRVKLVSLDCRDLVLSGLTPRPVRQKSVTLTGQADVRQQDDTIELTGLDAALESDLVTAKSSVRRMTLRAGAPGKLEAVSLEARCDTGDVAGFLRTVGIVTNAIGVGGRVAIAVTADIEPAPGKAPAVAGAFTMTSPALSWQAPGKPAMVQSNVVLRLQGPCEFDRERVTVKAMELKTGAMQLDASGTVSNWSRGLGLDLRGELAYDMSEVARTLRGFLEPDLTASGRHRRAFALKTTLRETDLLALIRNTTAELGLLADTFSAYGINATNVAIDVGISNQVALLSLGGKANNGTVELRPEITGQGTVPLLSVPTNSQVLADLDITDDLASKLLVKVHPIFYGCVVSDGKIDAVLEETLVPLTEEAPAKANVSGRIVLRDVVLLPSGLLGELLKLMKVDAKDVVIEREEISFVCRDGRVTPSPLELKAGQHTIVVAGSVSVDGMMQYSARLPVTEELVGAKAYPYLKNTTISVPISGPVARPRFDRQAFGAEAAGLAKQALKNVAVEEGSKLLKEKGGKFLREEGGKLLKGLFQQ